MDHMAVKVSDATYLPHTAGRYQIKRFRKGQVRRRAASTAAPRPASPPPLPTRRRSAPWSSAW